MLEFVPPLGIVVHGRAESLLGFRTGNILPRTAPVGAVKLEPLRWI